MVAKLRAEEAEILAELAAMDAKKVAEKKISKTPFYANGNGERIALPDAGQANTASLRAEEAALRAEDGGDAN